MNETQRTIELGAKETAQLWVDYKPFLNLWLSDVVAEECVLLQVTHDDEANRRLTVVDWQSTSVEEGLGHLRFTTPVPLRDPYSGGPRIGVTIHNPTVLRVTAVVKLVTIKRGL